MLDTELRTTTEALLIIQRCSHGRGRLAAERCAASRNLLSSRRRDFAPPVAYLTPAAFIMASPKKNHRPCSVPVAEARAHKDERTKTSVEMLGNAIHLP
jgi:hypothetical protein